MEIPCLHSIFFRRRVGYKRDDNIILDVMDDWTIQKYDLSISILKDSRQVHFSFTNEIKIEYRYLRKDHVI